MSRLLLLLALVSVGCAPNKQAPQPAADEVAEENSDSVPTPAKEPAEPAAKPEAKTPTSSPFGGAEGLKAWKTNLQEAMDGKKWDHAHKIMKELDPAFSHTFYTEFESQKVESFQGQLDASESQETVIQVRQHGQLEGHGEHVDFYWVGVIGDVDGKPALVGTFVRSKLLVCAFADRAGLTFGFTKKTPGLWIVEQDVQSCGTLIEVHYKKQQLKLAAGALVSESAKPPASIEYDRMEHMRDDE